MKKSTHWPSTVLFVFFLIAGLTLIGIAALLGMSGIASLVTRDAYSALSMLKFAAGAFLMASLLAPAVYLAYQRMNGITNGKNSSRQQIWPHWVTLLFVILWPTSIVIGQQAANAPEWGWMVLPTANLLAATLPLALLASFALRGVESGPAWRSWGIFGIGLTAMPLLAFLAEIILFALFIACILVYIGITPGAVAIVRDLAENIRAFLGNEAAIDATYSVLTNPLTLLAALLVIAVCIPIVEELLKPLGIWLFADHISSPGEGFALGILSGTAYAIFETLGASSQMGAEWTWLITARVGTGLLHILTTGLTSWGLALAWHEGRYFRLAGLFTLSVLLHATWNALSILNVFSALMENIPGATEWLLHVAKPAVYALGLQAGVMLILLGVVNRLVRKKQATVPMQESPK